MKKSVKIEKCVRCGSGIQSSLMQKSCWNSECYFYRWLDAKEFDFIQTAMKDLLIKTRKKKFK